MSSVTPAKFSLLPGQVTSKNAQDALSIALRALEDERLILADEYLQKIRAILQQNPKMKGAAEVDKALRSPKVKQCEERARETRKVMEDFDSEEDWTVGASYFGITTFYKYKKGDPSVWIKTEGKVKGSLFEQLAVVRETSLFYKWAPFCDQSQLVKQIARCELLTWFNLAPPFMVRDALVHAFAVDCMQEHDCIVMVGQSANETAFQKLAPEEKCPEKPKSSWGRGAARLDIKAFQAKIDVESASEAHVKIIANIDPMVPLIPQWMLNFVIKNMAGMLLYTLQDQARRIGKDDNCPHAIRMRRDEAFYSRWLVPKMIQHCKERRWKMPEIKPLKIKGGDPNTMLRTNSSDASESKSRRRFSGFPWSSSKQSKQTDEAAASTADIRTHIPDDVSDDLVSRFEKWKQRKKDFESDSKLMAPRILDRIIDSKIVPPLLAFLQVIIFFSRPDLWSSVRQTTGLVPEIMLVALLTLIIIMISWLIGFQSLQRIHHRKIGTFRNTRRHVLSQIGCSSIVVLGAMLVVSSVLACIFRVPIYRDWAGQVSATSRLFCSTTAVLSAIGTTVAPYYIKL